jgi:preprotein translocase subunit SecA
MMGSFGIPEDQPIENKMVSKAIESAQSKIEGFNFDARKHVLDYDDVMNFQRNKIYRWRREILLSDEKNLEGIIREIFEKAGNDFGLFGKKQKESSDEKLFLSAQRVVLLRVIDMLWIEHLETMEYMRSSVGLRAYGQRDPLVEYKNEGSRLFKALEGAIRGYYCQLALGVQIGQKPTATATKPGFVATDKVERNDPCPCGSGKKYKKCHGGVG